MSAFHRVERRRVKLGPPTKAEHRLPRAQSVIIIAGFSALSWAVLISVVLALRAAL